MNQYYIFLFSLYKYNCISIYKFNIYTNFVENLTLNPTISLLDILRDVHNYDIINYIFSYHEKYLFLLGKHFRSTRFSDFIYIIESLCISFYSL